MITRTGNITLAHDGTALAKYLRVDWSGTAFSAAAGTVVDVGTLAEPVLSGATTAVLVPRSLGTARKMVAVEAISKGADVYGAAGGKVGATVGTNVKIGIALEAAGADGDIIEVMPIPELQKAG